MAMMRSSPETLDELIKIIRSSKKYRFKKHAYYNVPVAFDTETTNYDNKASDKAAFVYIWMLKVGDPGYTVYGRDISEFGEAMDYIARNAPVNDDERLIVYIHNLGFDIEFIRHLLTITHQLNSEAHKPIFMVDKRGFEFRDSMILSGLSLAKVGEDLKHHSVKKKVGYLDYRIARHPNTPLSDRELEYCEGDVEVLAAYISEEIEKYGRITQIPYTSTGRVRKYARKYIFSNVNYRVDYWRLMKTCTITPEVYEFCRLAFMGGYTHANINNSNRVIENVKAYDLNSAYPAVMVYEKYPMGHPVHVTDINKKDALRIANDETKLSIWHVVFRNIERKPNAGDTFLSTSHARTKSQDMDEDNGRIMAASKVTAFLTNIDLSICSQCYTWDNIEFMEGLVWDDIDYLPDPLLKLIIELYKNKTVLKGNPDKIEEYGVSKSLLNSIYGMCVTRILKDEVMLEPEGWVTHHLTDDEKVSRIQNENKSRFRFLFYPWGVFISAYGRWNLWSAINYLGDDYIYADTDSIKVKASSLKLDEYLDIYRKDQMTLIKQLTYYRPSISKDDLMPQTADGKIKRLGDWDYEGTYEKFKTLGAKRYLIQDKGELKPVVAGIPRDKLRDYLKRTADPFDAFEDMLTVPADQSGRLASWYLENMDMMVKDYLGTEYHIKQPYGVYLGPVEYTLTLSNSYMDILKRLHKVF